MKLFLLCAGEGTRFRPHTLQKAKPAIPMLGIPMAYWGLDLARSIAHEDTLSEILINTYHLPETIENIFLQNNFKEKITFSNERSSPEILGSGGGLKKLEPHLKNEKTFLMMNGDEIIIPLSHKIAEFRKYHLESGNAATLLVTEHPDVGTKFGGVWTSKNSYQVKGFGKTAFENSKGWHYIGVCLLSPEVFKYLPENKASNILYDGLTSLISGANQMSESKVGVFPIDCFWRETGNLKDYLQCTDDLLAQLQSHPQSVISQKINDLNKTFAKSKFKFSTTNTPSLSNRVWSASSNSLSNIEGFAVLGENFVQGSSQQIIKNSVCYSTLENVPLVENDLVL